MRKKNDAKYIAIAVTFEKGCINNRWTPYSARPFTQHNSTTYELTKAADRAVIRLEVCGP
jgi:hypothetical protein